MIRILICSCTNNIVPLTIRRHWDINYDFFFLNERLDDIIKYHPIAIVNRSNRSINLRLSTSHSNKNNNIIYTHTSGLYTIVVSTFIKILWISFVARHLRRLWSDRKYFLSFHKQSYPDDSDFLALKTSSVEYTRRIFQTHPTILPTSIGKQRTRISTAMILL